MFSRFVSTSALVPLVLLVPTSGRAQESSDELIEKFIEKIVASEFEEANRYVLSAQCEDNELHTELILVANALLQRREGMLEQAGKLVGKKIALDTKAGKKKGVLEEVTDEELVLKVQIKVGRQVVGESTVRISWSDLTPRQEERLSRSWGEDKLALAVLARARSDVRRAKDCLKDTESALGRWLMAETRKGGPAASNAETPTSGPAKPSTASILDKLKWPRKITLCVAVDDFLEGFWLNGRPVSGVAHGGDGRGSQKTWEYSLTVKPGDCLVLRANNDGGPGGLVIAGRDDSTRTPLSCNPGHLIASATEPRPEFFLGKGEGEPGAVCSINTNTRFLRWILEAAEQTGLPLPSLKGFWFKTERTRGACWFRWRFTPTLPEYMRRSRDELAVRRTRGGVNIAGLARASAGPLSTVSLLTDGSLEGVARITSGDWTLDFGKRCIVTGVQLNEPPGDTSFNRAAVVVYREDDEKVLRQASPVVRIGGGHRTDIALPLPVITRRLTLRFVTFGQSLAVAEVAVFGHKAPKGSQAGD